VTFEGVDDRFVLKHFEGDCILELLQEVIR